ncbi:DNA-binding protein [Gordonia pseudamarae]|uniref:DNA-binding protein n=1 Tax=Gordonia pseudamarae TaxID=2831662 RepID=A0ABX6IN77_9ACTN|nr:MULTISPECIES: zinc ribbon domain-containing protein [Gordonia]MBD0024470.1 OB-fold domain-containing protein [Gordonia sp. (in: high G+C Gram-positive bacteria)]QHN27899.1 DNA-binding protein [Gordonia pseudamarae]QHN36756.1 DNA-binding protein [Gordonia pseudamarae]
MTATVPWGPAADGLDRPYWDGLVDGELRLQRCTECREWIWGPQSVCAGCYGFDIGWESVEPVGTIYSWSRSWYPYISELGDELPYISVLVELPQAGGRRLLGMLIGDPQQTPRIGERVVGTIQRRPDEPWPLLRWHREEGQA